MWCGVRCVVRSTLIGGEYYTVNPIAVRKNVDVYTANKRCVVPIGTPHLTSPHLAFPSLHVPVAMDGV